MNSLARANMSTNSNYQWNSFLVDKALLYVTVVFDLKRHSRAYDWWMDDMYLKNPIPLPVNSNPGMVFPYSTNGPNGFTYSIARFIEGILDYKHLIDRGLLPQDVAASREKGQHLCMQQYQRLFTVCRIPGTEEDRQQFTPAGPDEHIIVAYKNQFWKLGVKKGGKRMSLHKIWAQLDYIYHDVTAMAEEDVLPQPPVGILTTEVRTTWGGIREQLIKGIVTVQMIETALQNLKATPLDEILATHSVELPKTDYKPLLLQWKLDADIEACICVATSRMDSLVESLDYRVYHFTDYGKNFIKTCKVSPDVYIQLALQLTYFKLHNQMCSTYESASTRRYRHGRVDCIRSSTLPALVWVQAMTSEEEEDKRRALFASAADYQTQIMVANILGQGMDIHILGLRETAKLLGNTKAMQLFMDPSYEAVNHFSLTTSQIPTQTASYMGYGPVVPDGYGASYNPKDGEIVFGVSSFHTCPASSTTRFVETLRESLLAMRNLLEKKS
nr:EOG090X04D9 [Triops cancriformis]